MSYNIDNAIYCFRFIGAEIIKIIAMNIMFKTKTSKRFFLFKEKKAMPYWVTVLALNKPFKIVKIQNISFGAGRNHNPFARNIAIILKLYIEFLDLS